MSLHTNSDVTTHGHILSDIHDYVMASSAFRSHSRASVSETDAKDWESQNYYWRVFGILRAPLTNGAQELRFPIKRLPAELMAQVMYWYIRHVQEQARSDRDDEVPPTPYSWLTIRHVCRFWRNIAFQHPQLSTTICLTRYACIKEMVTLSGRLPIHVYERPTGGYHRTRHEALAILALVMDNLHRVATAEIDDWHWYDVNYANPPTTLPSETSPIQSLTWKSCLRRNVSFLARNASGPTILPRFSFPNLQHLSCYWVGVQSIRHMLHRSLLRLELHEPPPMSENSLLAILEEMPALEFLVLHDLRILDTGSELNRAVRLPCLRKLNIVYESDVGHEDPELRLYVFRHVVYPTTALVSITIPCVLLPPSSPIFRDLVWKLNGSMALGAPGSAHIQSLAVDVYEHLVALTLWSRPLSLDYMCSLPPNSPPLKLDYSLSISFRCQDDCINNLLEHLPLSGVLSAHFSETHPITPISLQHVVALMPLLESLSLRYDVHADTSHSAGSIHSIDAPVYTYTLTDEEFKNSFPRLKSLLICEDHLSHRQLLGPELASGLHLTAQRLIALRSPKTCPLSDVAIYTARNNLPVQELVGVASGDRNPVSRPTSHRSGPFVASQPPEDSEGVVGCRIPKFLSVSSRLSRVRKVLTRRHA